MKLDLRFEEVYEKPVDSVWRAITDRRLLARWLMENDFEPRVGHKFKLRDPPTATWRGWVDCEVLELDPPRRMVWSWNGGAKGEETSRLLFELSAVGSGTRLVLRHAVEATSPQLEAMKIGWTRKVEALKQVLGADYARRVAFAAPRTKIFDAIASVSGLRGWWTPLVSGSTEQGGEFRLEFAGLTERIRMRVDLADRPHSVRWTCLEHTALPDWAGTAPTFELFERDGSQCVSEDDSELRFRHVGLTPRLDCYGACELGWDRFLESLAMFVEAGEGRPFIGGAGKSGR
jgi:uncharacterized protein YndB with AHSA1/START domain